MTRFAPPALTHALRGLLWLAAAPTLAQSPPLIVVEDRGGASALPYYQALNLQPRDGAAPQPPLSVPTPRIGPIDESAMLPVHSARLSPGDVPRRVIQAPGLTPLFIIGDDPRSRAWLRQRLPTLRDLGAAGLVVNVESAAALAALRALAPGLMLSPVPADDLAGRLGLRHYPVLVTSTGIEQ